MMTHEVIIVGGGPAGLNAALLLGRCGRRTLLLDSGEPRNGASRALHGFLSRDGTSPHDLRRLGREQLVAYPRVTARDVKVTDAQRRDGGFDVVTADGAIARAPTLLLATGRVDRVPEVPGFRELLGRGVYHCPYCDAWEHHGGLIAVFGEESEAVSLATTLRTWSDRILLCFDGSPRGGRTSKEFEVAPAPVERLEPGADGLLARIRFVNGGTVDCRAMFFCGECDQRSPLPERLGCEFDAGGSVRCRGHAATNVPGLFVAGNVRGGIHLAIVAAAEGAEAAIAINRYLMEQK
jgi:thioredoxin reductase